MIIVWLVALVFGVGAAAYGSRRAVAGALDLAEALGVSSGFVGVTIVAIGTDLPEIANSISASISGHGDLNVGDSTGSALTQVTLILAVLLLTSRSLIEQRDADHDSIAGPIGIATVAATLLIVVLISDGRLGRGDGAALVALWLISLFAVNRWQRSSHVVTSRPRPPIRRQLLASIGWLAVVGVAATVIVQAFVRITDAIGVPELVASTVVLALGTSLPELVVDWTAIRRGASALAVGDLFGSSLVDATLSIGIGPMIRSNDVSSGAVTSVVIVAIGIAAATMLWRFQRAGAVATGLQLLAVYTLCTAAIVVFAG